MPQPSYGLQAPVWPQQVQLQMPCQSGQVPLFKKKSRVRAGRLGKRERAEVKAARVTQVQRSEGSEEETSGEGWLPVGEGIDEEKRDQKSRSRNAGAGGAGAGDSGVRDAVP